MTEQIETASDRRRNRKVAAAIVAGVAMFGVVGASAASLGGITSTSLGADATVVSSCDTDGINLAYTNTYSATLGKYTTTSVAVSGINAACNGLPISLTLFNSSNASLGAGTATVTGGAATIPMSAGLASDLVVGAAAVIGG
ncbi:MAG: hypothetical protein R2733_20265 [Acidimicrobiales bacterium]